MTIDSRQQHHFSNMSYDHMRSYQPEPHFTNPWVSAPPTSQSQMYATSLPTPSLGSDSHRYTHAPSMSTAYTSAPMPSASLGTAMQSTSSSQYDHSGLPSQHGGLPRSYGVSYTSAPAASSTIYAPIAAPQYSSAPYGYHTDRRTSPSSAPQGSASNSLVDFNSRMSAAQEAERQNFHDALDASRGMVAMSQSEVTPRNIYGHANSSRSSVESYGFPSGHSAHSSISSASTFPSYYSSSVSEASNADYSSASESVDMPSSRTLPRPHGLIGGPPAPQSMMGQFSSKVSSSSQKKHKCKICDKRFTRPSSLQTHMYSHTGEKRKSDP